MGTDISEFFTEEYGDVFQKAGVKEEKIRFKSLVYSEEFQKYSVRRKSLYADSYSKLKKELHDILKVSENEFRKKSRKRIITGDNKEGIALAMLAMRNELFEHAQYSNMEKAYKAGYDVPEKVLGVKFTRDERADSTAIKNSKEEFESDVDRFIADMAERIDGIVDKHEEKKDKGINWTWVALGTALFAAVDAMEYRMGYIAVEPFRLSFRAGAVHGIVKGMKKKDLKIKKWIWETTSVKPCENCQAIDGTAVTLEQAERFLHPNCKCTLTLIVE